MLLVIDVGNTNMVFGAMDDFEVKYRWRFQPNHERPMKWDCFCSC